jgi:hypothetical protein
MNRSRFGHKVKDDQKPDAEHDLRALVFLNQRYSWYTRKLMIVYRQYPAGVYTGTTGDPQNRVSMIFAGKPGRVC